MKRIVDIQKLRIIEVDSRTEITDPITVDVLIIGGGLGGLAATIAACEAGRTVCLTEETDWLGGQATSQGISALDENRHIETTGGTRTYQAFRQAIRDWYRHNTKLKPEIAKVPHLDPGNAWVSRLCFEPRVAVQVIEERLAPFIVAGQLYLYKRCKPYAVHKENTQVKYVDLVDLDSKRQYRLNGRCVIDATELGDLCALGAADYVTGAESKDQTHEPHAAETADVEDVQSFTYAFAIENRPGEKNPIAKPADYDTYVTKQPYTLTLGYAKRGPVTYGVFTGNKKNRLPFWTYRRLIDAEQFDDPRYPNDIAMINWPGNDYRFGSILLDSPEEQIKQLQAAKNLSMGFLYWLQHEVQRDEGGQGYPEFKLRPDIMNSVDGLSKFPYIRESRRILAVKTIVEQELVSSVNKGPRAAHFTDSVGIGFYGIDIHESKRGHKQIIDPTRPFQIPLGAFIPRQTTNMLAGCKNIGTTHISNGCYRLHPVEWAIGEAAGETASFCVERNISPAQLRNDHEAMLTLQRRLVRRGAPIMWYDDVTPDDKRFEQVQMLPFESPKVLAKMTQGLHAP